ncbi:hypothetical protein GH714_036547 [Hevea brasiliensis]|uniref:PARP alpha-helical domain-containing protein n=1 Tax=Hevea brasiliensis TaxID=3981 RepID=A0A6A6LSA6_HEVBR|nr:hypothetical protein GH714_036547 [Hevea brasiliensis]
MGYSFMIEYKTGLSNKAADALSRKDEEVELQAILVPQWVDWEEIGHEVILEDKAASQQVGNDKVEKGPRPSKDGGVYKQLTNKNRRAADSQLLPPPLVELMKMLFNVEEFRHEASDLQDAGGSIKFSVCRTVISDDSYGFFKFGPYYCIPFVCLYINVSCTEPEFDLELYVQYFNMFSVSLLRAAMIEFEINMSEVPLGKLGKCNIPKGFEALTEMQNLLNSSTHDPSIKESLIIDAGNRFFTAIPSIHPHVIRDEDEFT